MWRSVAIGVVLAGVLAGCSWGSGNGAPSEGGWTAYAPSGTAVATVVERMADLPGAKAEAKCHLVGLRAKCDVGLVPTSGPAGGVGVDTVWLDVQRSGDRWVLRPDCTSNPHDVLCRHLVRSARRISTVVGS
jgi:hypothetical protein